MLDSDRPFSVGATVVSRRGVFPGRGVVSRIISAASRNGVGSSPVKGAQGVLFLMGDGERRIWPNWRFMGGRADERRDGDGGVAWP